MSQEIYKKRGEGYDRDWMKPIVKNSFQKGEQTAGFKNLQTGEFLEIMKIHDSKDMDKFLEVYEISIAEITNE